MKDERGFTLIELMVVLGLAGIVISVVMSFFIANYKSYQTINTESEVQYQSQYIINFMTNKILEAESYEGKTGNKYEFKYPDGKIASFEFDEPNKSIKYTVDTEPSVDIGKYVLYLDIKDEELNDPKIEIILTLHGKEDYVAKQIVYMRNSSK